MVRRKPTIIQGEAKMALFAMAVPIPTGKKEAWDEFLAEINGPRKAEFVDNRKKLGVRERTFHQPTPMGDLVIITLEGEDPASALAKFGQGTDSFTKWFIDKVKEIHGVDLTAPPPGPPPRMVVDSG
jgi:hypothetical protein